MIKEVETHYKKVAAYFVTDGRAELLEQTLQSFHNNINYPFIDKLIVNDCTDPEFKKVVNNLANFYGLRTIHHEEKRGFAGVYDTAWKNISPDADFVFSNEDDFTYNEEINIPTMMFILNYNRNLTQCALKRQAWNEEEKKAGGIIEQFPDEYEEKSIADIKWTEHRKFFTTNPSLIPKHIIEKGWPLVPHSEGEFSQQLFKNPNYKSCFLDGKFDAPKVNHIGTIRLGHSY